jgi:N-acetyl-anhydromuramyl-L-alanine amidase AmpD
MKPNNRFKSPNFNAVRIPVDFLVLHYTAGDLQSTLELFLDPEKEVSAHLVLDTDGTLYELVYCWDGSAQRAWHAGQSYWSEDGQKWEAFNDFSIGIEIVNLNGNLFPYSQAQYAALKEISDHLRSKYPALNSPQRVIGHEQIAGWRGKVDPGICFEWDKFYKQNFPGTAHPVRNSQCHPDIAGSFMRFASLFPKDSEIPSCFWHAVSHVMETSSRIIQIPKKNHFSDSPKGTEHGLDRG